MTDESDISFDSLQIDADHLETAIAIALSGQPYEVVAPLVEMARELKCDIIRAQTILREESERRQAPIQQSNAAYWRSIETAPKNGTRFLATGGGCDGVQVCLWSETVGAWDCGDAMLEDWENQAEGYSRPTHWTPLPESPTGDEGTTTLRDEQPSCEQNANPQTQPIPPENKDEGLPAHDPNLTGGHASIEQLDAPEKLHDFVEIPEGFTVWRGATVDSRNPDVPPLTNIEVLHRDGSRDLGLAGDYEWETAETLRRMIPEHEQDFSADADIIAYRIIESAREAEGTTTSKDASILSAEHLAEPV